MSLINFFTKSKEIAYLKNQINHFSDILAASEHRIKKYSSSQYTDYDSAVSQLSQMYEGSADWGNLFAQIVVDIRAAFTVGGGLVIEAENKEKAEREIKYIEKFLKENNLDQETVQDWAKEAEIEGKFLCRLYAGKDENIEARFIPYTSTKYKVHVKDNDYAEYDKVTYRLKSNEQILTSGEFVYKKFGGRTHMVNKTPSKASKVITQMEALDKALWDWRKINKLFSSPTPYFKVTSTQEAEKLTKSLQSINWKIGTWLASTADMDIKEVNVAAKDSVVSEIVTLVKVISGVTGIPPHYLGMPDLMSNRATAQEMGDLVTSATDKERKLWTGAYNELVEKVLEMANRKFRKNFDTEAVKVRIPYVTKDKIKEIVDVWLPLHSANIIDDETILEKIPDIDIEQVQERRAKATVRLVEELKARNEALEEENKRAREAVPEPEEEGVTA